MRPDARRKVKGDRTTFIAARGFFLRPQKKANPEGFAFFLAQLQGVEGDIILLQCQIVILYLQNYDVLSLRTLLALSNCELDFLAFDQSLEARTSDRTEVSENVRARFLFDETKTFSFVEPFYGAGSSRHDVFPDNSRVI
jgi:hypothetical protein